MKVGIMFLRLLGTDCRKQEDASLKLGGSRPIRHENIGVIVRPIGRSGNTLFVAELKGLDASYDFVHVASHACGVVETEHEFVLWVDDEHGTDGERQGLLVGCAGIDHAVSHGDGAVGIADDWEFDLNFVFAVGHYVIEPFLV